MSLSPSFEEFERNWNAGRNKLVWARLAADLDTPVSLMLKLGEARPDTFMLESVTGGEVRGGFPSYGMKPDLIWRCQGTQSEIKPRGAVRCAGLSAAGRASACHAARLIAECAIEMPEGLPAVAAGLFGYLGYDMIRLVEHLPNIKPDRSACPMPF